MLKLHVRFYHTLKELFNHLPSLETYIIFLSFPTLCYNFLPPFNSTSSLKIASLQLPTDFLTQCLHLYRVAVGSRPHSSVASNRHLILGTQRESSHDNISGGRVNG